MTNVTLSASELVLICNMFHEQLAKEKSNPKFLELYGDLMLARDLCQYGHVDNFCLGGIVKCRNSIGNGVNGVLSDEDIDKFNNFLEDMPTALDNAEWLNDYVSEIEKNCCSIDDEPIRRLLTYFTNLRCYEKGAYRICRNGG